MKTPTHEEILFLLKNHGLVLGRLVLNDSACAALTPEHVLAAVQNNGKAIKFIRTRRIWLTPIILLAAVNQNGNAIKYIPKNLITDEIVSIAIENCKHRDKCRAFTYASSELIKQFSLPRKLESDTECLISCEPIAEGECYKVCSLKESHTVSFEMWKTIKDQKLCCYCKTELCGDL